MPTVTVDADDVVISLSLYEKVAGLTGNHRIPLRSITAVAVEPTPHAALAGWRAPGLSVPGRTKIGTWRASGRRTYVCLRGSGPAVRLEVSGEDGAARGYQAYLVSCVDPDEVAAAVARRSTSG